MKRLPKCSQSEWKDRRHRWLEPVGAIPLRIRSCGNCGLTVLIVDTNPHHLLYDVYLLNTVKVDRDNPRR